MDNHLELKMIMKRFKKRWKLISIILSLFLLSAVAVQQFSAPKYEARTDLFVDFRSTDDNILQANDIEMSLRLIETYGDLLKSDRMIEKVLLEMEETVYEKEKLADLVRIEVGSNSQMLTIIAYEKTAKKAARLVNTYASVFQVEMETLMNLQNIVILSEATEKAGTKEVRLPAYLIYIIAFSIAVIVSTVIIIAQEFYSDKFNTVEKIEKTFQLMNMGTIPLLRKKKWRKLDDKHWENIFSTPTSKESLFVEEFKRIRVTLSHQMKQKQMQTILVTSAKHQEGKSFISMNLAILMAMAGKKTIFVDANLRNPKGHQIFNLPRKEGVTSMITGDANIQQVIQQTPIDYLFFIDTGPIHSNPTELFCSAQMERFITHLKEEADVVIIDSPSLQVADVLSLNACIDGCLFVIDGQKTTVEQVSESLSALKKVEVPVVGTLLNKYSATKMK